MVNFADVDEQYAKCERLKREDTQFVLNWMRNEPHLPDVSELNVILFLAACSFNVEKTKACIEQYYTMRGTYNDYFTNRHPLSEHIQRVHRNAIIVPLPKLTKSGHALFYVGLLDPNVDTYSFLNSARIVCMILAIYLQEMGVISGMVFLCDLKMSSVKHMMRTSILRVRQVAIFAQEALQVRMIGFHFLNAVPFMDRILSMIKPFLKPAVKNNIQVHFDYSSLHKIVPPHLLPIELEGTYGSLSQIHEEWKEKLAASVQFIEDDEREISDESKRIKNRQGLFDRIGNYFF